MLYLKQSTAITVKVGPFIDDTDGKSAETAMGLVQADIRLSKNGGDIAQKTSATSPTHDELGIYDVALDATDTGTLGRLQLWVHKAGALPVWHEFMVVTANVYDTLCSTDIFDTSVTQWNGTNVGTPDTAGYPKVTIKSGTGTGEVNLSGGNIAGSVASVSGAVGSVTGNVGGNVTGSVGSVVGAVGSVTGNVGGNVVGSVGSLATQAKADVNTEVVDALTVDTYSEPGSVPAATSSLKDKIIWLFALARNRMTQTSTTMTLRNDADSGNIGTSTVSDDTTTTVRGEWL